MFPAARVRRPQAFSIRATSSVVVVLPFVPVMATTGQWQSSQENSSSPIISMRFRRKFWTSGADGIDPRREDAAVVMARVGLRLQAGEHGDAQRRHLLDLVAQLFQVRAVEHGRHRAPPRPALRPLLRRSRQNPSTAICLSLIFACGRAHGFYRSLRVARPKAANMMERIQNRTMTVFSFQPFSSK